MGVERHRESKVSIQCPRPGFEPAQVDPEISELIMMRPPCLGGRGTPLYGMYGEMPPNEQLLVNTTELLKKTFYVVKLKLLSSASR